MSKWMEKLAESFKKDKKRFLLILALTGVLILVIAWPVSDGGSGAAAGRVTQALDKAAHPQIVPVLKMAVQIRCLP